MQGKKYEEELPLKLYMVLANDKPICKDDIPAKKDNAYIFTDKEKARELADIYANKVNLNAVIEIIEVF